MVKKALLIGINYLKSNNQLGGCINDVTNMASFLTTYCNYDIANVTLMTDNTTVLPTRINIETAIQTFVSNVTTGDILVFYYAGHGISTNDISGDEADRYDELIAPLDYWEKGFIKDDWLFENMVRKIPSGVALYCFADSCHSGTLLDMCFNVKYFAKCNLSEMPPTYHQDEWTNDYSINVSKVNRSPGKVYLFTSCMDEELSSEITFTTGTTGTQGIFSLFLIKILNKYVDPNTKQFKKSALNVIDFLKEINCNLKMKNIKQNCQLSLANITLFDDKLTF